MRIHWLTTTASLDGPGRVLAALLNHWPTSDPIVLCAIERVTPEFRRSVRRDLIVHELGARGRWDPRAAARFVGVCRAERPDIIHTQLSRADWIGRPIARWLGVPVVSTIQNVHSRMHRAENTWPYARLGEALDWATAGFVRRFIAVSAGVRADLVRSGIAADRISVVHNAIDLDRCGRIRPRAPIREAWGIGEHDLVVGAVGLLKPQKGLAFLIRAARTVVDADARVMFVHIGDGPLRDELRALVAREGLADRFRWIDRVEEPMELLSGLDLFVIPSLWEGLPVALLEAMAAGLPCIGTRVSGIEEAIEHEVSGLTVPAEDAPALARAILDLVGDAARRASLGEAARARVRSTFDAAAMADAYARIYRDVAPRVKSITTRSGAA